MDKFSLVRRQEQSSDEETIKDFYMNKETELLEDIIQYLKIERELYDDFKPRQPVGNEVKLKESQKTMKQSHGSKSKNLFGEVESERKYWPSPELFDDGIPEIYKQIGTCNTLAELEELCSQSELLFTDLDGTTLVFGVGDGNADLVIIGEAPGAEEDKQGEPFVGRAGKLLNKILDAADFEREEVYITNILKHRPPNNRNPLPDERQRSLPFLLRQIDLINPKLILSLGKVSAQTLLNKTGSLKSMRGLFHPFQEKYLLLATYHPAALLRNQKWKRPTWEDFKMLRKRYDELSEQ